MLRTDLDNPAAMKLFREMYAAVMTDVSFEAGQNQVWTAESNAARGLVHEPQVGLGAAQTNRARSGEHVPVNEENHERVMRSKAAALDEKLRHADEALAAQQAVDRAMVGRWTRVPKLPIRVPQRVIAAMMSADLPDITLPLERAPVTAASVQLPVAPARVPSIGPIERLTRVALPRIADSEWPVSLHTRQILPRGPARSAPPEIANLRFPPMPQSDRALLPAVHLPRARPTVHAIPPVSALKVNAPERAVTTVRTPMTKLPTRAVVTPPRIMLLTTHAVARADVARPAFPLPRPIAAISAIGRLQPVTAAPAMANVAVIERSITRVRDALRRDDERRERERAEAARAQVAATERVAADEHRRQALARLFAVIVEERHYIERKQGVPIVDQHLLARFGLAPADVASDDAHKRLLALADAQANEVLQIEGHVRRFPHDIVRDGDGWLLGDDAPAEIRALVMAWRNDATMQQALGRIVKARPVDLSSTELQSSTERMPVPSADLPGAAWHRARSMREQQMAASDAVERIDDPGLTPPGRRIDRPGTDRAEQPVPVARRFPGLLGPGIGG